MIAEEEEDLGIAEDDDVETEIRDFGTKYFGKIANPYVTYIYNTSALDKDFGIRKDADGQFRLGRSLIEIDEKSDVFVDGKT